jgi:hypothetical protein
MGAERVKGRGNMLLGRVRDLKDETGGSIFEYDRPSSLFGQYGDERVTEVGRYLDAALEAALRNAAE